MNITKDEFSVLMALDSKANQTQRDIATKLGCSLGKSNGICQDLQAKGLMSDGKITESGIAALEPYKVDNAVILAAGTSSRFAPISYEMPKGMIKVKGEVLIERQIKQLIAAGIENIVLVVGYKGECFFYLEEKYGVKILMNMEFASRNNNSSLMVANEYLGNTYICSSDIYYAENPFSQYVWKAYYAAEYCEGPTKEWCMKVGRKNRIESVTVGGADSWFMIGEAYFDKAFSEHFVKILKDEYDDPMTTDKLWEQMYIEHIAEFDMEIKKCEPGRIFEFDNLDELRAFDPLFLENLDSEVFDNICSVLGCSINEIHDVYPLKQGLTNLSCHFSTNSGEYVYRHPGIGTDKIIDRDVEVQAQQLAKRIGIDDTFIFEDPKSGWKISRFLTNCRELDPRNEKELEEAMRLAHILHEQDVSFDRTFDYYVEGKKYESYLLEKGPITVADYEEMAENARKLREYADTDDTYKCLTHNDFFNLNLLYDEGGKLYLIDWEYAGMADYASDFGTFVVTCMLDEDEADAALECYFGRTPTEEERRHNYAYVALAGWCWYVWALQKESEGDFVGEWLYTYYKYAKRYATKALALYEK